MTGTQSRSAAGRSGEDDVVDRDEDELDEVADGAHDEETDDASLQDFHVFGLVGLLALLNEVHGVLDESLGLLAEALLLLLSFLLSHLYLTLQILVYF